MVQQIISLGWRLQRIPKIESGVFGIEMSEYNKNINSPTFIKLSIKNFIKLLKKILIRELN